MSIDTFKKLTLACAIVAVAALSGCDANGPGSGFAGGGNGNGTGPVTGGATGGPFPNNGTTPTTITNGGTAVPGHFICTDSAQKQYGATTQTSVNGLVGGTLTPLLNTLGGTTATALLNSVKDADLAIDGNLDTHSTFALTAGALAAVDSVGQTVLLPAGTTVPPGGYAVFAVQFPAGTVTAALLGSVKVTTYLNNVAQESISLTQTQIALLGQNVTGATNAFVGVQATKPYDSANISLSPPLLSADVGDAMHVNELCTAGNMAP
ncbi:MAG: hypothetical protein ACRETM_03345 [Stenotrophobium sp.]